MQKLTRHLANTSLAVIGIAAALSWHAATADVGVRALRLACPAGSDHVEIEPFIAWDQGNSPYPQFGAEQATDAAILQDQDTWFYAFDQRNQEQIITSCRSKTRLLRIFVSNQREITVTEGGRTVVDAVTVGDVWDNWDARYFWRSTRSGEWEECYGVKADAVRCEAFDRAHPRTQFLSKKMPKRESG
jgi:hypothetical protein